jgi:hypothetical protein
MEELKKFFMNYGRWVIIAASVILFWQFDNLFPNIQGTLRQFMILLVVLPGILCVVLTINPEELRKRK